MMGILAAYAVPHPPLIIPACGRGEERGIQATIDSYDEVARRIAAHAPDTIIISSPHAPAYRNAFALCPDQTYEGDFSQFRAPQEYVCAHIDLPLTTAIATRADEQGIPLALSSWVHDTMDWATFIPLWFVNKVYTDYQVVACGLSGLPASEHFAFGQAMAQAVDEVGKRVVYIASGDLSHKLKADGPYGYAPEGPQLDTLITEAFAANNLAALFDIDPAVADAGAECGLRSFMIMAGALDGVAHTGELLSYEGPFGVGYGIAAFEGQE